MYVAFLIYLLYCCFLSYFLLLFNGWLFDLSSVILFYLDWFSFVKLTLVTRIIEFYDIKNVDIIMTLFKSRKKLYCDIHCYHEMKLFMLWYKIWSYLVIPLLLTKIITILLQISPMWCHLSNFFWMQSIKWPKKTLKKESFLGQECWYYCIGNMPKTSQTVNHCLVTNFELERTTHIF